MIKGITKTNMKRTDLHEYQNFCVEFLKTHPEAMLIPVVHVIDEELCSLAGVSAGNQGTGGMVTKLQAAKICMDCGCEMIIANGSRPENLYDIMDGFQVGTKFTGGCYE